MGSSASIATLSSEELIEKLIAYDEIFKMYTENIITHKIDGTIFAELTSQELIKTKFNEVGITNEEHLDKLSLLLLGSHLNCALVFIKPQANTEKVQHLVKQTFIDKGFTITADGEVTADEIDKKRLIDNHYYAIASKATLVEPKDLPVPKEKFQEFFGVSFEDALSEGSVYNALQASEYLGMDPVELGKVWRAAIDKTIKLGGGFYAAKIENIPDKKPIYVFNGFFMSMRSAFVKPASSIHFYVIEWNPKDIGITWAQFRKDVLGCTDPSEAESTSLRGQIFKNWEELGLSEAPMTSSNGVHGSASPLEGLSERCNWLGADLKADKFAIGLGICGINNETLVKWCKDEQIEGIGSVFDYFEDIDVDDCYSKAKAIKNKQQQVEKE